MKLIESSAHESWKQYLGRGGALNLRSYIKFQERYPHILKNLESHESMRDACDAGSDAGIRVSAQFCAAFSVMQEPDLQLETIRKRESIYWHSNEWLVREALILIKDPEAQKIIEPTY